MIDEEFEFLLTQYLDGALSPAEVAKVENRLAEDAEARNLLEEYRRLNGLMREAPAMPNLRWDVLSGRISDAVAGETPPVRSFKLRDYFKQPRLGARAWAWAAVALAACVLVAVGVAIHLRGTTGAGNPPSIGNGSAVEASADVTGPQIEIATGPAVAEVQLLPPQVADAPEILPDSEGVVRQPSHVSIASAAALEFKSILH
jgi:anti-sigma factor RsiW